MQFFFFFLFSGSDFMHGILISFSSENEEYEGDNLCKRI
jgi:hypothetical protein